MHSRLGHPPGLFLIFIVEMWERFSYYGMRALLALYLVHAASGGNPGRGWPKEAGDNLFGWYTGGVYLLSIAGGLVTDRLLGAHRSVVVGGLLIALGHMVLAASGIGELASNDLGMSVFIGGLVLIVLGTGHFKPNMPVMVAQFSLPGLARAVSTRSFTVLMSDVEGTTTATMVLEMRAIGARSSGL